MTSALATRVLTALGPTLALRAGALFGPLVDALTKPLADTDALVQPTARGWTPVFDLNLTPYPASLGQLGGTIVPAGLPLAQQRTLIRDAPSWRRGTVGAMTAAVEVLLTGFQRVDLLERTTSPWQFTVRVYAAQLAAGVDAVALLAAVNTQKPVGLIPTVEILPGASYTHMTAQHGPTYADFATAFPTYATATLHVPEEGTVA